MNNLNDLKIQDTVIAFIDHQPFVAFPVRSISPECLTNNVVGLAKVAKALEVPVVLTTINASGGPLNDPLFSQLTAVFPEIEPIDRRNTNAWSSAEFVAAVKKTGRKRLVLCGLWTEVCLAQTVLSALKDGFDVTFVSDASGGVSEEAHADAKALMIQAGAKPMTWMAVMAALCPDNTSPEYSRLYDAVIQHGGGVGYAVQYVLANLNRSGSAS
jgi:nicotinamidase-related amidase